MVRREIGERAPEALAGRRPWRRALVAAAASLGLLVPLAIAFAWFVVLPSRQGTRSALVLANAFLAAHSDLRLVVASARPLGTGLRLADVNLLMGPAERADTLVSARRLHLDLDWLSLLLRRPHVYRASVEGARVRLSVGEDGRLVLPAWRSAGEGKVRDTGGGTAGGLIVRLHDASFELTGQRGVVTWWEGGRLGLEARWVPGGSEWELSEWTGAVPPLGLHIQEGRARASAGGGVFEVEPIAVRTDAGSIEGRAEFRGDAVRGELSAREWPWEFFAEILDQPALDVPGEVQVRGLVEGSIGSPRLDLAIDGTWRAEDFAMRLLGRASQEALTLERASLDWSGTRVTGQGGYSADGRWHLEAHVVDLDLSDAGRLVPALRLPRSRLAGPVRVEGEPGRMRVVHESLDGDVGGIPLAGLSGEWTLSGRSASWALAGGVGGGDVRLAGEWDGESLGLSGEAVGVDWAEVADFHPSLAGFRGGESDIAMTLDGPPDSLAARFTVVGSAVAWRGLLAERLVVEGGGRLGARAVRLGGTAFAQALHLGSTVLDSARVRVLVGARELELVDLAAWRGDTTVVGSARFTFDPAGWSGVASELRLATASAELAASEPVVLRGEGAGLEVRSARFAGTLGRLALAGVWRPEGESDLRLSVHDFDPGILLPRAAGFPLSGAVALEASLTGRAETLSLQLDGGADTLWLAERPLSRARLALRARRREERLVVESFSLATDAGRLGGRAEVLLAAAGDSAVDWSRARDPAHWQGELTWEDLELDRLAAWLPEPPDAGGRSEGRLVLRGPPGAQSAECRGSVRELRSGSAHVDLLTWRLVASNRRLRVEELAAELEGQVARVSGEMPFVLAWSRSRRDWLPEEEMHLAVHLPAGAMRFLPLFIPVVAAAEGRLSADLRLAGTPGAPNLHGQLAVENGVFRPSQREEVYRDVRLLVRFEGERALIERLEARQGKSGRLSGRGEVHLFGDSAGRYRLDLTAAQAVARSSGEYAVQFSGALRIQDGPRSAARGLAPPYITGDLRAESGVILYDFTDPGNVVYLTGPRQAPLYTYDLHVVAESRVFWRTPGANIELEADLSVSRDAEGHKVWGTVEALRGSFYFLENKFVMERGALTFDQAASLDAKLDAAAVATVTHAVSEGRYEKEEVHIELSGRMQEPAVRLWSSSGLSEKDIFALLTFGRFGLGEATALAGKDQRILVGVTGGQYLMRQLAREFPEIESLVSGVELGTTTPTGSEAGAQRVYTTVGVNSYVTPELRLGYSQVLGGRGEAVQGELKLWGVSAEYRIGRLLYLTGEVIERRVGSSLGSGTFQNQVEYNLDVRARIDY